MFGFFGGDGLELAGGGKVIDEDVIGELVEFLDFFAMDIELVSLSEDMIDACASDMEGDNFGCGFKASESDGQ